MAKQYPYIEEEYENEEAVCVECKKLKTVRVLEWRIWYMKGDNEIEKVCHSCFDKREAEERKRQQSYVKKMTPIWNSQSAKHEERKQKVRDLVSQLGLEIKTYPNGQWNLGNLIDWWTTTGTAIARKSRNEYKFSFKKPQDIIEALKLESPEHLFIHDKVEPKRKKPIYKKYPSHKTSICRLNRL